jgi:streptomycin 6-kinase
MKKDDENVTAAATANAKILRPISIEPLTNIAPLLDSFREILQARKVEEFSKKFSIIMRG